MVNLNVLIIMCLIIALIVYFIAFIFKPSFTAKNRALKWGIIISLVYVLMINKVWNAILEEVDVADWIIGLITIAFLILPSLITHLYDRKYNYNKQYENINADNVKNIITKIRNINKLSKKNKIIFGIVGVFVIAFFGIGINRIYQKNKILKFDYNFEASYVTYVRGLGCMLKNYDSYESRFDAKQLIINGIDIAKNNEENVPTSLKENYKNYISSLEQYSMNLNDNGEVNSYFLIIFNKLKKLEDKYNISKEQLEKNVSNKLKEYNIEYNVN